MRSKRTLKPLFREYKNMKTTELILKKIELHKYLHEISTLRDEGNFHRERMEELLKQLEEETNEDI